MQDRAFPPAMPRSRALMRSGDTSIHLIYYPPGLEQRAHHHARPQVTFLLAGCLAEECEGRDFQPMSKHASIMPAGQSHAVRFGREGALMMAIEGPDAVVAAMPGRSWHRMDGAALRRIALIGAGAPQGADLAGELAAAIGQDDPTPPARIKDAPAWLRRSVQQIADDPELEIDQLARDAGLHRVSFSRGFQRWTGMSPTEFRLLRKSSGAMRRTMEGKASLAQAALDAGFADQAHWSRTCRALTGIPPGKLRRLLDA